MALTRRQKQVLDFLQKFIDRNGYSPSFEEIAAGLGLRSLATVHKHLQTLEKKGHIRRGYNQSRSLEIIALPQPVEQEVARHATELPLVGRIAAGFPVEAVENAEMINLADFARSETAYVLQVKGDSMVEDHICDKDYIIVEKTETANNGDIVVALIGGEETTLKRFYRDSPTKIRLQPANSDMDPVVVPAKDVALQGRVVGVLRRY